jgi:hypothetical protein
MVAGLPKEKGARDVPMRDISPYGAIDRTRRLNTPPPPDFVRGLSKEL